MQVQVAGAMLELVEGGITLQSVDAIVNAANSTLLGGGGVGGDYPRPPLRMAGGTEFRFVTEGIHAALEQAVAAAGGRDIRLGGGVSTIQQYLKAAPN